MDQKSVTLTAEEVEDLRRILHLDNGRDGIAISEGARNDMAKERRRVIIGWNDNGTPIYKQIQGEDQEEVNVKVVRAFIDSGRIWELMPKPEITQKEEAPTIFREYAEKWLTRKRKIKANSLARYRRTLKEYIYPCVGEKYLTEIGVEDVQAMLDKYSYLAQKTLQGCCKVTHDLVVRPTVKH